VSVGGKVDASGHVILDGGENGIQVIGKVSSSGRVEIRGWVEIGGDVDCSGNCKIQAYGPPGSKYCVKVSGRINPRGSCTMEGNTVM